MLLDKYQELLEYHLNKMREYIYSIDLPVSMQGENWVLDFSSSRWKLTYCNASCQIAIFEPIAAQISDCLHSAPGMAEYFLANKIQIEEYFLQKVWPEIRKQNRERIDFAEKLAKELEKDERIKEWWGFKTKSTFINKSE